MQIAAGIRRLGIGLVNVYLVEEAGGVTIVDTGLARYYTHELPRELAAMGRSLADIRAVVLTHAHSDHLGFAEKIRSGRGVRVWVHEADAELARGEVKAERDPKAPGLRAIRPMPLLRFLAYAGVRGGVRAPPVLEVSTFGDGATLDVPGAPRVFLAPGHTAGSTALLISGSNTLLAGDVIATLNVMSGVRGPQLAPFGADFRQAYDSLARLDGVDAQFVLPGHGEPWTAGLPAALEAVRRRGRP